MSLPDDLATTILSYAQARGSVHITQALDGDDNVESYEIVVTKTAVLRVLACVSKQFARLHRAVLRSIGRDKYRETVFGDTRFVHIRFQNFSFVLVAAQPN